MLTNRGSFLLRYGAAVVSIALATWVRLLLDPALGIQLPYATLFFAVLLTAWFGGFRPALLSSVLGALSSSYFLLPPRGSFSLEGSEQYFGMVLYMIVSLGIAVLGGAMRAAQSRAEASTKAERHQAALINQTYDAVLTWDWNGPITFWNRGAERLYGIPRAEALGRVSHDLLRTSTPGGVGALLESLEREGSWEGEIEHTSGEGKTITVETRMVLVREAAGTYVLETCRDITLRRRAEAALRDVNAELEARVRERTAELARSNESTRTSERRLAGIVNSAMDAIITVDSDQKIVLFNAAAEKMFRCHADIALGRFIDTFIPQRFREGHRQHVQGFGKTGITSRSMRSLGTFSGLRADGEEFPIEASISQIEVAGQRVFTVIIRDITERKRVEEEIRQLNTDLEQRVVKRTAELEAANRELEAFSYSVSHDLRAPLRAVDGFSQAVVEDYAPQLPEEGRRYLETIRRSAQRMGELIDDLLMFSRLSRQPLNTRPVDTGKLVRHVLEEMSGQLDGRHVEVRVENLRVCYGDPALLKQVWTNLLSNALKFTSKREAAVVEIGCAREQGENVFFVRDNGTGFDMQYAGKLFGVFQRLHRADEFEGTGVGLAIVQRVIHRHGGRVWADAAVDRGAAFYFTLEGETTHE